MLMLFHFCGICRRQCHYEFNRSFPKSCIVFCTKPKEVDPIKLISLRQISVSIALKYVINNSVLKRIRSSMMASLSFFIEIIFNHYIILLAQRYTNFLSPERVHLHISLSLRWLVLCLTRTAFFVIYYCLFIFFKELISSIGSLDKCHTSVFNALIIFQFLMFNIPFRTPIHLTIFVQIKVSPSVLNSFFTNDNIRNFCWSRSDCTECPHFRSKL